MEPDWNALAGELRSALAAQNWNAAGAVVWQLRQLDQKRYTLEFEHYTNQQVRQGRRGVALETEQRLAAVRQWAEKQAETGDGRNVLADFLFSTPKAARMGSDPVMVAAQRRLSCLDWESQIVGDSEYYRVRADMRDVIWSVLQEYKDSPK